MKKFFRKKIFAFFLSALLVLALSLPVFADMGPKPSVTLKLYYTPASSPAASRNSSVSAKFVNSRTSR